LECLRKPRVPITSEFRNLHKDGSWRSIEAVAVNRLDEPAVAAIVVNYRDVTERRRAELALRSSEERLRHIVEHAQDIIYYCDTHGHFTYVNPTAARVMKYTEQELLGRHFLTLIRADYQERAARVYTAQRTEGTPSTYFEFPSVTKDGDTIWIGQHVQLVYDAGKIVAVHAIARDITRQKHAEERLRESEAKYRLLIERSAFGIYRSTEDGRILEANEAVIRMLGYSSAAELTAVSMADVYQFPADRHALLDEYRGRPGGTVEMRWKRKDGTPILVRLTARTIEEGPGGQECYETIAEDVTERRALEEQLRQAQKMEAVGRLARGIAHDFNNVLAAIVGSSELIAQQYEEDHPTRIEAEEIRKAAERGAALTKQLMAFSQRQALDPRVVNLHSMQSFESTLQRMAGADVSFRLHADGPPPHVRVEPGQLEQVLMNLVVNARDAMPAGGTIDARLDTIDLDERHALDYPGMPDGPYARIAVHDTGIGMDEDVQRQVFEPFFTTKGPAGTGLGLSIVYSIAKEAGGTVTCTSAPNEGTTFEVLLPLIPNL
jgi:PAS domain S-box-containing protein